MRAYALPPALLLMVCAAPALAGCATYQADLVRAQQAQEAARYEDALTFFAALAPDVPRMAPDDRARFYFLRGLSRYRLRQRNEALYDLSLAREEVEAGARLDDERAEQLPRLLEELTPVLGTHRARRPLDDAPTILDDEAPPTG